MPDVVKTGQVVKSLENSWMVEFDDEDGRWFVSKKHAEVQTQVGTDTVVVTMPGWLWEKMAEEGPR